MQMITHPQISKENTPSEVAQKQAKFARYALCYFISDLCRSANISREFSSVAMHLTNLFFIEKHELNYNKLIIACAAVLLASKDENSQIKLNEIANQYLAMKPVKTKEEVSSYAPRDKREIKEIISKYEIILVKALNYNIQVHLPEEYIYVYTAWLYPYNELDLDRVCIAVSSDSFFTSVNNVHKIYTVAISCMVIAAKFLDIPTVFDKEFDNWGSIKALHVRGISVEEFDRKLLMWEKEDKNGKKQVDETGYFEGLELGERLYPGWSTKELVDCIDMMMEFYIDSYKNYERMSKKAAEIKNERKNGNGNLNRIV